MAQTLVEFGVSGTPVAHRAASRSKWQARVASAARATAPLLAAIATEVTVLIAYFHHNEARLDVDNMAKPILGAIKGIVLDDDGLVTQLTVRKSRLHDELLIENAGDILALGLAGALSSGTDFVYLRISPGPDHGALP